MRNGGQRVDALGSILGLVAVLCSSTRHLPQGLRVKGEGGGGRIAQDGPSYPSGGTTNSCGCSMPRKLRYVSTL